MWMWLYWTCRFWIVELFDDVLNQNLRVRTDAFRFGKKIRFVPVAVIRIFRRHIRGDHNPAFRRIASVVGTAQVAVFVVHMEFLGTCADFQCLFEILPGHGVVNLVIDK